MMTRKTAAPIVVPTLAESDAEYASIIERSNALNAEAADLGRERAQLRRDIAADTTIDVSPAVAELLGQAPSAKAVSRKRLAEVNQRIGHIEEAIAVLRKSQQVAESRAGNNLCRTVRPEYGRRVAALCAALETVDAAHRDLEDLRLAVEAEGASSGSLGAVPWFLGGARDPQRRVAEYAKIAKEAGYAVA